MESDVLSRALSELNDKERDILLTYYQFYDGERFKVPIEFRKSLCALYSIQDATLRKTKDRALEKIKKHIQKNTDLLPIQLTATNG